MIRSSKHTIKFANKNKQKALRSFLKEYRTAAAFILDYIWNNPIKWGDKTLDISNNKYDCPQFISTSNLKITTPLSARALKCCSTQVCGMVKAALEKPRRRLYVLEQLKISNKSTKKLEQAIAKNPPVKPNVANIKAELNSICCDYMKTGTAYSGFLQLKSIGKSYGKIRIPIKHHRHSKKLSQGDLLKSFLISNKTINFRYRLTKTKPRTKGATLGADQGYKDILTLSNSTTTPKTDAHGHTLESITGKLARKRKGSKAFKKAQQHRKNYIHWSINQLNFGNIKQLNLEEIINITYKKRTSRLMSHWNNTIIRDKLYAVSEQEGFSINLQPSAYRSQRCSKCGWVRKSNRKSKQFICTNCGHKADADYNAACNLALDLPRVSKSMRNQKLNYKGFFWNLNGFSLDGEEFTVSLFTNKV